MSTAKPTVTLAIQPLYVARQKAADILAPIRDELTSDSHGKTSTSELDEVHRLKQEISKQVKALVKELLKEASPRVEELVRTQLTDEFRFWR